MNYLQFYCDTFNLTLQYPYVFDKNQKTLGEVESNEKYVHFYSNNYPMKISDLLALGIERINVHD